MARSSFAGTTDYSHQSLDDILVDLDDWITGLATTLEFFKTNIRQLQNSGYWDQVVVEMKDLIAYASKFYETSIKEITEIRQELEIEVQNNHISRLNRLARTANVLNRDYGRVWHREYKPKDYGNPNFLVVEKMYSHGRDMVVDMLDIGNAAARLGDYIGRRNNQLSKEERTPPAIIVIDNSQHINQSGSVNVHSERDTSIGGDVVGLDKTTSE